MANIVAKGWLADFVENGPLVVDYKYRVYTAQVFPYIWMEINFI